MEERRVCMMEEKGMFRSAIGGFNKTDVLSYIDELTASWNEERVQLENQARADRERANEAEAVTAQAQTAHAATHTALETAQQEVAAAQAELAALRERLAVIDSLTAQNEALREKLAAMRTELDEALAKNNQLTHSLAQSEEKNQSSRAEMMAAEERLAVRETELTRRNERLAAMEAQLARYEAALGSSNGMKEKMDALVRPFADSAARRAEDTLDDTYAVIAALLAQLGELQGGIEEQKRALRQEKTASDTDYDRVVGGWFAKVKELADAAAERATHFFR